MDNRRRNYIREMTFAIHKFMNFTFPFPLFEFIDESKKHNVNIRVKSYSHIMEKLNCDVNSIITECTNSEDGAVMRRDSPDDGTKKFYIMYNDTLTSIERIRFTIAHELGHIFLLHLTEEKSRISRHGLLSESEYDYLETEANFFATELLSPKKLFKPNYTPKIVSKLFNVSMDSSIKGIDFYERNPWIVNVGTPYPNKINFVPRGNLNSFIIPRTTLLKDEFYFKYYYCDNCKTFVKGDNKLKFCYICGSHNLISFPHNGVFEKLERDGANMIKYDGVGIDYQSGCALECPRCHCDLDENDGEFCEICGTRIYNRCTGINQGDYTAVPFASPQDSIYPCERGSILNGQARFCPYCGCISTFFYNGDLKPYTNFINDTNAAS